MLGLTFANEADYDKILEDDTFNFVDLKDFSPGMPLTLKIVHPNQSEETILLNHSYNQQQIDWFKAGSALDLIRKQNQ
jgi:aconitate hydratase